MRFVRHHHIQNPQGASNPLDASSLAQQAQDLQYGILSINEVREGRGLEPVPWGDVPFISSRWMPADQPRPSPRDQTNQSQDYQP
jgi:hypothetical protein